MFSREIHVPMTGVKGFEAHRLQTQRVILKMFPPTALVWCLTDDTLHKSRFDEQTEQIPSRATRLMLAADCILKSLRR